MESLTKGVIQSKNIPIEGGNDTRHVLHPGRIMSNDPKTLDELIDSGELEMGGDILHFATMKHVLNNVLPPPRKDFAPKVREYLQKVGNDQIVSAKIVRAPISKILRGVIDTISLKSLPPDTIYHLYMVLDVVTNEGIKPYKLEKNHIIEFAPTSSIVPGDHQEMPILLRERTTVNQLLDKTRDLMGEKFFPYDAFYNNCQDFIMGVLRANGLLEINPEAESFVKQDMSKIMNKPAMKFTSKVSNFVTDLAGKFDRLIFGKGISDSDVEDVDLTAHEDPISESDEEGGAVYAMEPTVLSPEEVKNLIV